MDRRHLVTFSDFTNRVDSSGSLYLRLALAISLLVTTLPVSMDENACCLFSPNLVTGGLLQGGSREVCPSKLWTWLLLLSASTEIHSESGTCALWQPFSPVPEQATTLHLQ